ncbi:MAG: 3-deoxy-D-manno-octulosonic acid transferase [Verrucomicrobia bacterium]|nr:3-deoxy-D-manno-octulosonic acid transferase [Verrucomicrobiota bacterium]
MLWLYRLLFLPVLVVMAPAYVRRMRKRGGYRENFRQRFGSHTPPPRRQGVKRVWLQAVSVGEMLAIGPLLEGLVKQDGVEVYLTTTTSTGYRLAGDRYRGLVIGLGYFPIDWWLFSARAWKRIDPDLVILTEGERWPEHMQQAASRGVPAIYINARLSDRSYRRMLKFPEAAELMLHGVTKILPGSAQDETRFRELGVPPGDLVSTGNIKLDVAITPLTAEEQARLRRELGLGEGLVLLGSSTWPGEEQALVEALEFTRQRGVHCTLLIVPRHAERRLEIEKLLTAAKLTHHFRSRGTAPGPVDVAVGDTTGELRKLTQLADLVFVGKSLAPHTEGQTPVEAAALEKPIMFGPGMSNFRLIAADLVTRGAAIVAADPAALTELTAQLLRDAARRATLAAAAGQWRRENAGAVARTLAVLREELAKVEAR